jgi:hypothetical protein
MFLLAAKAEPACCPLFADVPVQAILFSPSFMTQLVLGSYGRLKTLAVERFPGHVATQVLP